MKIVHFVTPWLLFVGVYATSPKDYKPKSKLPKMEFLYTATVHLGMPLPLISIPGGVRGGKILFILGRPMLTRREWLRFSLTVQSQVQHLTGPFAAVSHLHHTTREIMVL